LDKNKLKIFSSLKIKKYREKHKLFLIEGNHLVNECLKSKYYSDKVECILINDDFDITNNKSIKNNDVIKIKNIDFKKISETQNSQGIIAVVNQASDYPEIKSNITVLIDNLSDPGNLGTILRNCYWFGVKNVLLSENTVDVFNSKVLRATQGAFFHLAVKENLSLTETVNKFLTNNYEIILASLNTENYLENYSFSKSKNYLLIFGNEAHGISDSLEKNKELIKLKIKGYSDCESLNVAVSSGIFLSFMRKAFHH
jgi:RNA methyltransferase, TrmH family